MTSLTQTTACVSLAACLLPAVAFSQPVPVPGAGSAEVARALDRTLPRIEIRGEGLAEALTRLGDRVGVKITIDERSAALLPWGDQTRLKEATIENASLREVLPKILGALGMTYQILDDGVRVVATPPLKRINGQATWEDLKLLRRCNELPCTPESFAALEFEYRITSKVNAPKMLGKQLTHAGRGTMAEMLEVATGALGWVWLPYKGHIVIRTAQAQTANQMARRITARYANVPLARILVDLATKAETPINFEPGMMLKLPASTAQSYTLLLQGTSIRQAFELIQAETGLTYKIRRDGLYVGLSDAVGEAAGGGRRGASPYVGKITVRGGDGSYAFDILLRRDELPEDILEYRRQIIEEYVQRMRGDMAPVNAGHSADDSD
ncbi:MAG: hypothetical protein ACE5E1_04045 [Phycisphaerae bacterium]